MLTYITSFEKYFLHSYFILFDLQNPSFYIILIACLYILAYVIINKGAVMIALQITNTKQVMNTLLVAESFDSFQMEEVTITTYNTFHMDGHMIKEFYSSEELDASNNAFPEFSSCRRGIPEPPPRWRNCHSICI